MRKLLIITLLLFLTLFLIKRKDMTWRQSLLKAVYPVIMLKQKLFPDKEAALVNQQRVQPPASFYELIAVGNNGVVVDLNQFKGKKILIVNTASDCGYTGQFAELEKLHQQYKDLVILGFPANDFKDQEKKNDKDIAAFCKVNYGVTFQLMQKSHVVKGMEQNPIFLWLSNKQYNGWCDQPPVWNFCKYVIDEKGVLTHFFKQTVSPLNEDVIKAIQ